MAALFLLVLFVLAVGISETQSHGRTPPGFPRFSWDTLPVFWHAWAAEPFNQTTLEFISRFPLATIEKGMSRDESPRDTDAEDKIVAAAKQIKEFTSTTKVLFYLNSQMDWFWYNLHQYCLQHKELMWLYDSRSDPVVLKGQNILDMSKVEVRTVWMNVLVKANQSGYIDGAFIDRGDNPQSGESRIFRHVNKTVYDAWTLGHRQLMTELNATLGHQFLAIANGADYEALAGRMFERFMANGSHNATSYADISILQHEATYPHIAEVHIRPCTPATFNTTLAGFLIAAGPYAYYGCTNGFSIYSGWLHWFPEYSKKLGEPLSAATPIHTALGFCADSTYSPGEEWDTTNGLWEAVTYKAASMMGNRRAMRDWVRGYMNDNPSVAAPILGRRFQSGTCVTLDFASTPPASCVAWADGTHTGSTTDCLHKA